jgi:hypothetical protein
VTQSSSLDKLVNLDREHSGAAAQPAPSPPRVPLDAATEHFDLLLGAVTARLKRAADAAHAESMATGSEAALQRLRVTVVECVEALEQLQATRQKSRKS